MEHAGSSTYPQKADLRKKGNEENWKLKERGESLNLPSKEFSFCSRVERRRRL